MGPMFGPSSWGAIEKFQGDMGHVLPIDASLQLFHVSGPVSCIDFSGGVTTQP